MKKILFVINTLGLGGAEMALIEMLNHFPPDEYDVSLYVLLGQGELVSSIPDNVRLLNRSYSNSSVLTGRGRMIMMKNVFLSFFRNGHLFRKLGFVFKNLHRIRKSGNVHMDKLFWRVLSDGAEYNNVKYDMAVAYIEGGSTYYVADHVNAECKAAFFHTDYGRAGYGRWLDMDCYSRYDGIFAVSDEVRDNFIKEYPEYENITHIFHNIVNQDRIKRLAAKEGGFDDGFEGIRILTVGRLNMLKAYDIAISAMEILRGKGYNIRWYALGEGDARHIFEKMIKDKGLERDFILMGTVNNPYPYYKQCDIYVHATRYEGKSLAIQEAQTLGCAVIASDCSGNREQINDGIDGILCELTPEAVCESIENLIHNETMRMELGSNAGHKIFSYVEDMNNFLELLKAKSSR